MLRLPAVQSTQKKEEEEKNTQTSTGQSAESSLSTRAGGLGSHTTSGAELDVDGSDAELLWKKK